MTNSEILIDLSQIEEQTKVKPVRSFKYNRAERVGRKVYYNKTCLHYNCKYESVRMDATFCCYRCAKAARRKKKHHLLIIAGY